MCDVCAGCAHLVRTVAPNSPDLARSRESRPTGNDRLLVGRHGAPSGGDIRTRPTLADEGLRTQCLIVGLKEGVEKGEGRGEEHMGSRLK